MGKEIMREDFLAHVAKHEMTVEMDNGINRHIRFADPETINLSFQLTTWRDHLCFSGDMGTFVFSRTEDMFRFFRSDKLGINTGYWHEKLQAVDRSDGSLKYSQDIFDETIKELFDDWFHDEEISEKAKAEAWEEVKDEILCKGEFECDARHAVDDFESNYGFEITDFWEACLNEYTRRFIWCLYAIVWGIQQYDKANAETKYYVRNIQRGEVGNCVQWWRKEGKGYSCNLDEAEIFSFADAKELLYNSSKKYEIWPCDEINKINKKHVDCQNLHKIDGVLK